MNTWVEIESRWMGIKKGEPVVYRVAFYYQQGKRDAWHITSYLLECEETSKSVEVPYDKLQAEIAAKGLINIGQHTKEQWIEMSKPKTKT